MCPQTICLREACDDVKCSAAVHEVCSSMKEMNDNKSRAAKQMKTSTLQARRTRDV